MNKKDKDLILEFKKTLAPEIKKHLKRVIVFGSRARGEALQDSDLDVIVLVDEKTPEIEKNIDDTAYQVMWNNDFNPLISLKVFDESRFYDAFNRGFSFYKYVERDGVDL